MNGTRWFLILALAVLSGLGAGYTALRYLSNRPPQLGGSSGPSDTRPVVLAAQDLPLGKVLEEADLVVVDWPASVVPEGYAGSTQEVIGRSLVGEVRANEAILMSKLADYGILGLIALIDEGRRAMSVRVDEIVGVAGFVTPQTRVDIILVMTPPGGREPTSKIILQNIQTLAAGSEIRETEDGRPVTVTVATVLVTPEEAEKLALAETQGTIRMALRNTLDVEPVDTNGEVASRLFTGASRPRTTSTTSRPVLPAAPPEPEVSSLRIYNGVTSQLIQYNRRGSGGG